MNEHNRNLTSQSVESAAAPLADNRARSADMSAGPRATGEASVRSVALILLAGENAATAFRAIHEAETAFGELNWDYEVIALPANDLARQMLEKGFADEACQGRPTRLLAFGNEGSGAAIAQAIHGTSKDWIALADAELALDDLPWQWLAGKTADSDIGCFFRKDASGSWLSRMLLVVVALLTRLLLKTGRHEHCRGLTFFRTDRIRASDLVMDQRFIQTELMARARLDNRPVVEVGLHPPVDSPGAAPRLKARQVLSSMITTLQFWWNAIMFPQSMQVESVAGDSNTSSVPGRWRLAAWLSLIVATLALLSSNLSYPLFEPDEARNAQLGLNIYQTGEWMTLTLAGEHYWGKPPLVAWVTATAYHLLGVHEFSTRLSCNLSAFLTVMMTFLLGQRLIGFRAAWCGAILLLLSGGFVMAGRYVTMDAALTLCTTTLLLSGYLACRGKRFSHGWWLLAGTACGVGMLVKGPIVGVIGLPPLLAALGLANNRFLLRPGNWLAFVGPLVLISGPWFIAMSIAFFPDYMLYFFWTNHVVRFSDAFNHHAPFWYYLPVILLVMYPASTLFPSLVAFVFSRKPEYRQLRTKEMGFLLLIALWVIGFFSLSESKLPTYVLPSFPAICLLLGKFLEATVFAPSGEFALGKWIRIMPRRVAATLAILIVVMFAVLHLMPAEETSSHLAKTIGMVAVLLVLTGIACLGRQRSAWAWGSAALVGLMFVQLSVTEVVPRISQARSIHAAASAVCRQPEHADSPVVFYCHENHGSSLWNPLHNQLTFGEEDQDNIREFLRDHPQAVLVSHEGRIEELQKSLGWSMRLLPVEGRRHVYVTEPNPAWIGEIDAGLNRLR